jgi:cytochrome c peroxidase
MMDTFFTASLVIGAIGAVLASANTSSAQTVASKNDSALITALHAPRESEERQAAVNKVSLGKLLFFDPRLSGDNSMSCATCHLPSKAFTDGRPQAKGRGGKTLARNTPTLLDAGFQSRLMWDGRAESLEAQALLPIQSPDEMHQDLRALEQELNAIPGYVEQFNTAFGTKVTRDGIAKALAAFERSLVTRPSPHERYLNGEHDALSPTAKRGRQLFFGDAGCVRCHSGPHLTDGKFHRLGVSFKDDGLAGVTGNAADRGKFRTPSLRNAANTAPYMHDGSLNTLEDVVAFYYRTAPMTTVDDLPLDVEPLLGRSYSEIADIVAFLESLAGEAPVIAAPKLP